MDRDAVHTHNALLLSRKKNAVMPCAPTWVGSEVTPVKSDRGRHTPQGSTHMQNHGALQQEYLSGLPRPPPGHLLDPEIEPGKQPPLHPQMIQTHLFTKQKKTHKHGKQTYGSQRGQKGWEGFKSGVWSYHTHTAICKANKDLLCGTGSCTRYSDLRHEKSLKGRTHRCPCKTESLCCTPGTNTTL